MITHTEFANATQKLNKSADKVITMIDACFSQGVVTSPVASRSISGSKLTAKFFSKNGPSVDNCPTVNNPVATCGMLSEVTRIGGLQENFVQISSSRSNEVSWDDPGKGGYARQAVRD